MAKKRSKKGSQYQGGRPMSRPGQSAATSDRNDMMPRDTVLARLREVPVFGLSGGSGSDATTESGFLTASDGMATLFMDSREAEKASSLSPGSRLKGVPLDEVYFDQSVRLKPSDSALKEATTVPNERALVANVKTPLFAIDGMQTTDKDTGVNSLPLFFSKAELLEFAIPVYGPDAAERVLITTLEAVVTNMVRGPAGLLRDAKFFADAKALTAMDKLAINERQALFPTAPGNDLEAQQEQGLFGGIKMPWM